MAVVILRRQLNGESEVYCRLAIHAFRIVETLTAVCWLAEPRRPGP
jgi:hypothetical protein